VTIKQPKIVTVKNYYPAPPKKVLPHANTRLLSHVALI